MHVVPTSQPQTCTIVRTILLVRRCHRSMSTIKTIRIKTKSIPKLTSIGLHIQYIQCVFVLPYFNIYICHFTIHISIPTGSGPLILLTLPECWFVSIWIVVCFRFKYQVVPIVAVPITVMEEQTSKSQNLILTVFRKL